MPRKLAFLAGLLAALIAAAALFSLRRSRLREELPLKGLREADVAKLELSRLGERAVLENRQGLWTMTAPVEDAADAETVRSLLAALSALSVGSEVSGDPSSYAEYELSDSSATRLRLFKKGEAAAAFDGYFGRTALGYDSIYFRYYRQAPVYLAAGLSQYAMQRPAADYRDRSLTALDRDTAERVTLAAGSKALELSRSSAGWTASGRRLPAERVDAILRSVFALRASGFPPGRPSDGAIGLSRPALAVRLSGSVRESRWLIGGLAPASKGERPLYRYARVSGRPAPVLLPAADVEALLKAL